VLLLSSRPQTRTLLLLLLPLDLLNARTITGSAVPDKSDYNAIWKGLSGCSCCCLACPMPL
jgi:hypothetical protein